MKRIGFIVLFLAGLGASPRAWAAEPPAKASTPATPPSGKDLCKQNFDEYRDRIKQNPDDNTAWQELRVCSDLLKRWGEAGAIASAAIDRGVKRPEAYLIVGLAHYHTKDYNAAVDDFKESLKIKEDQAMVYFQLGLAYLHLNQASDAVGAGVRAAELDPYNSAYHHQLAFSYYMVHEDEKCEIEAKKALEIDSNDVAAYKILANLYGRQGKQTLADQMTEASIHANGRVAAANPFVPDKKLTEADMPHPFQIETPPADTADSYLKAQWEKMKEKAAAGDVEATASFYSTENGVQDAYRNSFNRMGAPRMHEVFSKLGELSDCEINDAQATASCRCPVNGGAGTMLETKVTFRKNADHIWRIASF